MNWSIVVILALSNAAFETASVANNDSNAFIKVVNKPVSASNPRPFISPTFSVTSLFPSPSVSTP